MGGPVTALPLIGTASMLSVAIFTFRAYRSPSGPGQSPRSAVIEAWFNLLVGASVNAAANIFLLPLVGAHMTLSNNFWLTWCYTAVSIVRQYTVRRWFNARMHAAALRLAGTAT